VGINSNELKDVGCEFHPSCLDCPRPECYLVEIDRGKKPRISKRYNEILKLKGNGLSVEDISTTLGVSKNAIYKSISRNHPKVTIKQKIFQLHGLGMNRIEICQLTGASMSYVRHIVYKYLQKPLSEEI
jgi:predicted DNA-binding protein YlxM (UPF0122 family)